VIIPVYNRPEEVDELLDSLTKQSYQDFEVIIIEDGSDISSEQIVTDYRNTINRLTYERIPNGGPGPARNKGAAIAKGDWLIFFDSDCIIPQAYFQRLSEYLNTNEIDAFGGPDRAHEKFNTIQKAISYSMTSILTTGGIRGSKSSAEKFKPRSFNLGIRRTVFDQLHGFSSLRFGEDMDLSLRLEQAGFKSTLVSECWVYHKRRTKFKQFYKQVFNSGMARVVLGELHPGTTKVVHLFPLFFTLGLFASFAAKVLGLSALFNLFGGYGIILFVHALITQRNLLVAVAAVWAGFTQLVGYGIGFAYGYFKVHILGEEGFAFRDSFYH
jgi:glycosyltransferase involved in cell wall biosynthesis